MIAEKVEDTRALEGFLLQLSSFQAAKKGEPITEQVVSALLGKQGKERTLLHPDTIIDAICDFYSVKSTQIRGERRNSFLVRPRHMCMYLLKQETRLTYIEIGNLLGGRDHTTVMHGVDKVRLLLETQERVREEIEYLKKKLSETN